MADDTPVILAIDKETGKPSFPYAREIEERGQLFAMHLADVRDYDPDHPRGLRKVTETR